MASSGEHLALGELGAFVDTQGANRRQKRRKKFNEASDDANPSLYRQDERDEVEEMLESLVFGNQPFRRTFSDSSSEEVRKRQPHYTTKTVFRNNAVTRRGIPYCSLEFQPLHNY